MTGVIISGNVALVVRLLWSLVPCQGRRCPAGRGGVSIVCG